MLYKLLPSVSRASAEKRNGGRDQPDLAYEEEPILLYFDYWSHRLACLPDDRASEVDPPIAD